MKTLTGENTRGQERKQEFLKVLEPLSMKDVMELEPALPSEWFFNGSDKAGEYMKVIRWVIGLR